MFRSQTPTYHPFPDVSRRNLLQRNMEIPLMVATMNIPQGVRILEVGCGRGVALPVLARLCRPNTLVGIDIDPEFISVARSRIRNSGIRCSVRTADVRELPFENGCFDIVVDFGTCYHISDQAKAIREISRVLATGGRLVHETRLSQLLSHPVRSLRRSVDWDRCPSLSVDRKRILWASRIKLPPRSD